MRRPQPMVHLTCIIAKGRNLWEVLKEKGKALALNELAHESQKGEGSLTVRIVTDSTSALPKAVCRALGIEMVSATIHFGTETFVDGVDPAEQFYERLRNSGQSPTTSTPSPAAFHEVYSRLTADGSEVISIHLLQSKSATYSTACMAAQMLGDRKIHVVDSRTTSRALGLLVTEAARLAAAGQSAEAILLQLETLLDRVDCHAVIRDMTQLRRSGRVSLGKALVAGILAIKPVLYIGRGLIEVVDKARGWPGAVDLMVECALSRAGTAPVKMVVLHTDAAAEAQALLERIRGRFGVAEAEVADAGTAVAAHAGPGALGIATVRLQ